MYGSADRDQRDDMFFGPDDMFSNIFTFKDPHELFKEFFNNDPFGFSSSPFGFGFNGFASLTPGWDPFPNNYSSFTTFSSEDPFGSSRNGGSSRPNVKKSTTTTTKYVNGKKIETRK